MKIELNEMARQALDVARERERLGQLKSDTFSILKHCAGEIVEAADAFTWINSGVIDKDIAEYSFADELADIITCVLIVAAQEDVYIDEALFRVQDKNLRRIKDD